MINNGITFIRVVKTADVDDLDFSAQMEGRATFQDVQDAIARDWYRVNEIDQKISAHITSNTLDILKAEFSAIDDRKVIPMWDEEDPSELLANVKYGYPHREHQPFQHGLGLLESNINFEVSPLIMSLTDVCDAIDASTKRGHFRGIAQEQLLKARKDLYVQRSLLLHGTKSFHDFRAPVSMVLTGAQIKESIREGFAKMRDDILLHHLFDGRPETYQKLSVLSAALG